MSFISTKFHEILLSVSDELRLQEKQEGLTDWLTDGRVKNIIPSATRCVGYNESDQCQAFNIPLAAWGGMYGMSVFNQHLYLKFDLFVLWRRMSFSGKSGFELASWIDF